MKFVDAPEGFLWEQIVSVPTYAQVAVLFCVFGILMWQGWKLIHRRPRKTCKWRKNGGKAGLRQWRCTVCGVDAFSQDRKPPRECKRMLRPTGL